MANPANRLPPQYDDIHPTHYDASFTEDISTKMRVPHKLGAFTGDGPRHQLEEQPGRPMMVPERILLAGQDQHIGLREDLKLDLDGFAASTNDIPVPLATPPRSLRLDENPFPSIGEAQAKTAMQNGMTPRRVSVLDADLLASPGDGLLINDGDIDDFTLLRREVAKLKQHVRGLEEENSRRFQRELILYPILGIYTLFQIAKWLLKSPY